MEAKKKLAGAAQLVAVTSVGMILFGANPSLALCQAADSTHDDHAHHLSLAIGSVFNLHEHRIFPGLGLEFERLLPVGDRVFGIGAAAEMAFDEHRHYVISLLTCFHPVRPLGLTLAPGVMFIEHNGFESRAAIHFGVEYEFEVGGGSLAPSFELAFAGDDVHLMLGVHVAFGF